MLPHFPKLKWKINRKYWMESGLPQIPHQHGAILRSVQSTSKGILLGCVFDESEPFPKQVWACFDWVPRWTLHNCPDIHCAFITSRADCRAGEEWALSKKFGKLIQIPLLCNNKARRRNSDIIYWLLPPFVITAPCYFSHQLARQRLFSPRMCSLLPIEDSEPRCLSSERG